MVQKESIWGRSIQVEGEIMGFCGSGTDLNLNGLLGQEFYNWAVRTAFTGGIWFALATRL
jgi:hypothetical protein